MPNLYRISQTKNKGWDTFDSAIVVALTDIDAKYIHPLSDSEWGPGESWWEYTNHDWADPDDVSVELIGTTHLKPGVVVCASFNAG